MNVRRVVVGWTALVFSGLWLSGCGSGFFANPNTTLSFPAYVADAGSSSVSGYKLNPNTGALIAVAGSPFPAGRGPEAIGTTSVFLYAANVGNAGINAGISGWTINSDGTLTPMSGSPFLSNTTFASIAVDPRARFVYAGNANLVGVQGFSIAPGTGILTLVGGGGSQTSGTPIRMTVEPSGRFVYIAEGVAGVDVFTITPSGLLTGGPNVPLPAAVGVAATSTAVYVVDAKNGVLAYSIDNASGNLTPIGSALPAGTNPSNVAVMPSGAFVFVTNAGSNNVSAYSVGASGALTEVSGSPFATGTGPSAVAVDPSSRYVYVTNYTAGTVSIFAIGSSGQLTPAGTVSAGSNPNDVVVVPLQ